MPHRSRHWHTGNVLHFCDHFERVREGCSKEVTVGVDGQVVDRHPDFDFIDFRQSSRREGVDANFAREGRRDAEKTIKTSDQAIREGETVNSDFAVVGPSAVGEAAASENGIEETTL